MQFDARAAKLLAPGAHIIMDDCPGLRLKATNKGRAWIYRYKSPIDGKMRQIKIGQWPAMSLALAISLWEELRRKRDAGNDPAAEKKLTRNNIKIAAENNRLLLRESAYTVKRLCDDYLSGHIDQHRKKKGATEIRRMFNTMLGELANVPASSVTRAQAFDLLEGFNGIPVQSAKLRAELGAAWDYSLDAGRLPESTPNWWRLVMRGRLRSKGKNIDGKKVGTSKRVLSEAELSVLVPWLPNFSRLVEDALTLYLWTGSRGGEIMAMTSDEISEESDGLWWTIPKQKTKNARHENATDHRVALVGRAARIIKRRMEQANGGYLFPTKTELGHTEQKVISESVYFYQPYCKVRPHLPRPRLTVSHWAPHDLRRTSRTLLASIGCPDSVAEAILGHMQAGIKGVYNRHSYDKERREWLTKLDLHLESLVLV